ncbi:nucleoside 2-deoxyribosyltransferase [Pelomyxa schiedti]|nr:nucleoside 2-deoxyribosyltransferase [Pelomyxa schiedti]
MASGVASSKKYKVYFCGSIRGGRGDQPIYEQMVAHLGRYGPVLTAHVASPLLTAKEGEPEHPTDTAIYRRDMDWLEECDCVVAEVTLPSLGVGFELGQAVALHKPTLALYRPQPDRLVSAMISGCPQITTHEYTQVTEAIKLIDDFFTTLV